jgi:hypothetical protein
MASFRNDLSSLITRLLIFENLAVFAKRKTIIAYMGDAPSIPNWQVDI